jgi:hypothetical protein
VPKPPSLLLFDFVEIKRLSAERGKTQCRFIPALKGGTKGQGSFSCFKIQRFSVEGFSLHDLAEHIVRMKDASYEEGPLNPSGSKSCFFRSS